MPLLLALPQQRTPPEMVGMPKASAPTLVNHTGEALQSFVSDLNRIGEDLYKRQVEADLYDRLGKATAEVSNAELQLERDPDFRTAPQRFQDQADAISAKYLDGVSDTAVATAFKRQFGQIALSKSINIRKSAWKKEADYNVSSLDDAITTYANAAANAKNPAEASIVEQQARLHIARMQAAGWISAEDAGKRERTFLSKRDTATVLRDMSIDPSLASSKLSIDPTYAPNIDPVTRERFVDQAFRRADAEQRQQDAQAERDRKARGDELMKEALSRQAGGTLDRNYIEEIRQFIEPAEYKSLLAGVSGADRKDDPSAFANLESLVETNPAEARRRAFQYHRSGLIRNETLATINNRARTLERQEGPKSEYERSRQFIADTLRPSPLVNDPAGSARYGLAVREFDDFASANPKATDKELRDKANDIQKRFSLVDMAKLAQDTSVGAQPTPEAQLKSVEAQAIQLMQDRDAKKISQQDFSRKMADLDKVRRAAEKAAQHAGK